WTPLKSSLLIQYMVDQLIGSDGDIENTNALAHFGRETFELLYPEFTPGIEPVVPTFSPWNFDPLQVEPDSILYSTYDIQKISESNPENGSNNWAVSGSKTKSGHAILANDTHLGLNLPSLWIMMQLHSPNVNTTGFTFTGAPGIVLGFNENIAWGFTNAPRDQRDWYRLTYNPENKEEYLYKGKYIPLEYRYDSIFIRNEEPFIDTIKVTEIGPVVYDNNFPEKGSETDLAFKWIGHNPSRVIVAISMLNRSTNYEDYKKALEYWDAPSQNVVFADTKGDIALRIEGTFPLKWKEQGKFIMDAGREKHLWSEYIPHDQNAFLLNPERGFVSSANQHSVDSLYPYYVYNESNETYRNRRINSMLSKSENTTVKDMMRMQYDSYSMLAEDVLWFFYDSLEIQGFDSTHFAYYHDLGNWNFTYTPNSITPSFFEAWWTSFKNLLWDEMDVKGIKLPIPNDFQTTYLIKNQKDLPFFDIDSTEYKENLKTLINLSYSEAVEQMDKWKRKYGNNRWGTINNVTIKHLTRIPAFSTSTLEIPGSGDAINAANGNHGPSQRIIVEMTSPPTAWVALPGGQSGNPGSPRYMDYLENYKNGKYSPLQLYLNLPTDTLGFNQEFKRK
ncbi:MAG: penicillin acylase family protein, partial [Cyclobacteriaceae bacterium]|nr:penicillin acylase family protein [Cyclobacteriaceae bacterium]